MIGTIIGAIIGYILVHKLPAVILGALAGYFFYDRKRKANQKITGEQLLQAQALFFKTVFNLLGHIAKSDGHISKLEVSLTESLMDKMGLTPDHRREAIRLFKEGASPEFNLKVALTAFRDLGRRSPNLSQMLLVYLINLAMADGELHNNELGILEKVADSVGFSRATFEQLVRMIGAQNSFATNNTTPASDLNLAYQALGVTAKASDADIKKAYRKLMSQYHPDKLMGQGLPEDMIKSATERAQDIQAAYDLITKARQQ
jgi:DnaJ like chaperone protein